MSELLERRAVVRRLAEARGETLFVAGLGSSVYDLSAADDNPLNFYIWGAMGASAMIGLGLALARPDRPVCVLTGDGEMLMGLGALATIAQHKPENLSVIVLDNEQYAETGQQRTATGHGVDLTAVAASCGFPDTRTIHDQTGLEALAQDYAARSGVKFATIKISAETPPRHLPIRDGVEIKLRFRNALLGHG